MSQNLVVEKLTENPGGGEYEREPVPSSRWSDFKSFAAIYAGEHAAGTEFMIGPLFLTAGVSAFDLLVGLLLGNLLAVLSWRFLTAEIATKNRLTLYYQLEKICGKKLVIGYNLANGILFCFLAGAMVTVSATAVGVPFNMEMPRLNDTMPSGLTWIVIVLVVGMVISIIAARGYHTVSNAAKWMSPLIIIAFIACGIIAANQLGINTFAEFWNVWGEGREPFPGQLKFTFWHVLIWSWFTNAAHHIGMSDLTILRFAKTARTGWASATGMYIGHYLAWIAGALLYAVYLRSVEAQAFLALGEAPPVAPGPLAYNALGIIGIIAVVFAGWTTANPVIYRAGLAFQAIMPKVSTFWTTFVAGTLATIAGLFPAFAMQLLNFVAIYGFLLAPFGAIIVFEHFFYRKAGIIKDYAEKANITFNKAVFIAWSFSIGLFWFISVYFEIFLSYVILPAWLLCGILYLYLSKIFQKKIA
jgi:nucleobase:cation symporter-1, NCS1 family